jgi:hypothetical protein
MFKTSLQEIRDRLSRSCCKARTGHTDICHELPVKACSGNVFHFIRLVRFEVVTSETAMCCLLWRNAVSFCTSQSQSQSQSHIATDGQSVSQYVLVSSQNLGHLTRDLFFFQSHCLVFLGRPLWREVGSVMCHSLSLKSISVQVHWHITLYVHSLRNAMEVNMCYDI